MERNTPVRKQHTSTTDLLVWSETPINDSPPPPSSATRSHQPLDGINKVVFGGQVTDEEVQSLNKRDELGRFVADKRNLKSPKIEGCSNLGGFVLSSSSFSTLWLSDLHSLSKMVFNCPQLREISLEFSCQENASTDLITMIEGLGRSCLKLQNIHIASMRLSHAVVLALTAAQLRLRMSMEQWNGKLVLLKKFSQGHLHPPPPPPPST